MKNQGCLERIWLKRVKRGPMDEYQRATLRAGRGLVGNANQGGKRQVTLIESEKWSAMIQELDVSLDPAARRANLLVSGIDLANNRGRILRIGNCRVRVWGETRPCERMDEAYPGLQQAMQRDWRGGICAEVLDDGDIAVGDSVVWEEGK